MSGLLSGLEQFGLSGLENMDLYEKPKREAAAKTAEEQVIQEQDFLFDKTFTCPICDKEFKSRTVKIGKAKLIGTDMDLRPKYEHVDLLKYDIIMCPSCGYAALSRYFKFITSPQAKRIKEIISSKFKPITVQKDIYTYDEALERYKLTLANAIVKMAKPSEKAYICLKTAWLLRGKGEALDKKAPNYEEEKKKVNAQEKEFLKNALDGFLAARQSENFPMCGMDEPTVDYLISVIATRFEQYDVASKLISQVIASPSVNPRMKDKARDLKEQIIKEIRVKNAAK
ncbi:DUF2225 domain-containing protein [Kineothrix sp. MB12-C1]|uniref:DUF2225 domain-containing protein n=1 Tax=Kineothrix sp. MB12-C1 TaxID=3070215 RepID=UPI0027D2D0B6|nr:DUF2225 domain-containing protein [Kineothrix sp. MB12-C1]WMC91844.1 DUF2225 domain-containing protein [Kineothrix sp. MB12-C1]